MVTSSKDVVKLLNHLNLMIQLTRQLLAGWSVQQPCANKMPLYHFCSKNASQVRPTRAVCTDFAASVQMGSIQCWHLHDNQENSRDVFLKDSPGLATNGLSLSVFLSRSYIRFDRSRNSGDRVFCLKTRFQTHRLCRTKMLNERRLVALRQPHGNGLDHSKPCWILNAEHQSSVQMDVMILPK